jgi:putative membrane protein
MTAQPEALPTLRGVSPKKALALILFVSAAAVGLLVVVIYGHGRPKSEPGWAALLPATNALLNATSATFLVLAYRAVRRRSYATHARHMARALASSSAFLVSYIVYHAIHGDSRFGGHGLIRAIYFFVLITHVALSGLVLPLIFSSFFLSLSGRFRLHRTVSRFTLPVWLYVSVTGVLVYVFLRLPL